MDFFEVISKRRSIRHFTDDPVREDDLKAILQTAGLAPNAHNAQRWHFIVVQNQKLRQTLKDAVSSCLEAQRDLAQDAHTKAQFERKTFHAISVFEAPVVITALATPEPYAAPEDLPVHDPILQSVAAAIAQMHLAATALGYGGCWTTYPIELARTEIEAILEVPKPWYAVAILSIGVPSDSSPSPPRKPIEEIVTFK